MNVTLIIWISFIAIVLFLLSLDLFIFHRNPREVKSGEAFLWSLFWIILSVIFGLIIGYWKGATKEVQFFTGYLIEYSLSIDNLFIFAIIFRYFKIPSHTQHHVLFWGIIGALIFRGMMIGLGVILVRNFHWILYLFGLFLIYTGFKMMRRIEKEIDLEKNLILQLCRRILPVSKAYDGSRFITFSNRKFSFTPLLLVLIVIEGMDLVFAVDSVPAVFAVTQDPLIIFTSNICAILGLRSLYFLLAKAIQQFTYLSIGLGMILTFIGLKMLLAHFIKISDVYSLLIVAIILVGSILISIWSKKHRAQVS